MHTAAVLSYISDIFVKEFKFVFSQNLYPAMLIHSLKSDTAAPI